MIVTRTFAEKSNTISRDQSCANLGLNPIIEVNYGRMLTRGLIYFDHSKVKSLVDDCTYPDITKLKHVLKMTNCGSINPKRLSEPCNDSTLTGVKKRVGSFDLIFFYLPNEWDEGRGFDFAENLYEDGGLAYSMDGSTWVKYKNYFAWPEPGVYSIEKLTHELELFTDPEGNKSDVIFAYKHFDYGNEDLELDITDVFNSFIKEEKPNNGFGIAFSPYYEKIEVKNLSSYVGFFGPHTNSFFEPYIETTYDEVIEDDRANFYLNKVNKLYFYASVGGNYVNLDNAPTCEVNGVQMPSKQATKGVYYVELMFPTSQYEPNTMYYDTWSNIMYNGKHFPDVELDFTTKSPEGFYSFGLPSANKQEIEFEPMLSGINHKEQILRGDIRKINVDCHIPYTSDQLRGVDGIEYRIFVRSENKEIDAISWQKVERGFNENFFLIDTNDFIPYRYHIDLRVSRNMELTYYRNSIEFDIVSDIKFSNK